MRELNEELRTDIEKLIARTKEKDMANKFLDSLKTQANYVFNEEILALPDSGLDPTLWVMVVNSTDTVYENRLQKDMLKDISVTYLLRSEGKKLGYFDKPKAIEAFNDYTNREAQLRTKNSLRDLGYTPNEEEIEQFFNANFEERYKETKPLHIQHIIFEDSAKALVIRDSILAGAGYKEMALNHYPGEPEIREVAYDLGYISEKELGQEFFDYVNSMKAVIEAADSKIRRQYIDQRRSEVPIIIEEKTLSKHKFPESCYSVEITPKG